MPKTPPVSRVLDVLKPYAIALNLEPASKNDLLQEMVWRLFPEESDEIRREILNAILEREKLGSTGIGFGIAVPHAKCGWISSIACAFAIVPKGINFEALDQAPVYLVFLLVAPPQLQSEHLNILARIVRMLKNDKFRQSLQTAVTADEVIRLIAQEDT